MQWNVLCINRTNATTSQDNSTITFDRERSGYKYRTEGRRQEIGRKMEQISTKREHSLCGGGGAVSSGFVVTAAHLYITICYPAWLSLM